MNCRRLIALACLVLIGPVRADTLPPIDGVEGQPLAANAERLVKACEFLGAPLPQTAIDAIQAAVGKRDAAKIQELLDPRVLVQVAINPESRVKVARGPAASNLQQAGFVPTLVKVVNEAAIKGPLNVASPQAGPVHSQRDVNKSFAGRFLHLEPFRSAPMTANLSGLKVEYVLVLVYSAEAGKREATLAFDVGQGTQDLGFRAEIPILFDVKPGVPVKLSVRDFDDTPTIGRFTFKDAAGHVFPPQAKRLAPDLFFQQQIYRGDGDTVLLPPGEFTMEYGRGPEYRLLKKKVAISAAGDAAIDVKLERWVNPAEHGFFNGDHHIHAAGCAHYTSPSEGVHPPDMFRHVKGEGLNVGCCLTWGPCFDYQRTFFESGPHKLTEPFTVLKYDVEVSGFGSQQLGHVCLLNLRDQTYPGSDGTKTKGWPTWTTPLMRWAKAQGAVTGYAHSANGLNVNGVEATRRLLAKYDADKDGKLSRDETKDALLPLPFADIDSDNDGSLSNDELIRANRRASDQLPNLAVPEMNGIGAQEICVTTSLGLCDFISAMDTGRVPEWNCWYHIMNCGFPLKVSGETDFPCITGSRVGQGRVYVQLGAVKSIDFGKWCDALAQGRSYVSDGYAHALAFHVNGQPSGNSVALDKPGSVAVKATVAFAAEQPLGTSNGGALSRGRTRKVEIVVNGQAVASKDVPADDKPHEIEFAVPIAKSSWVALRHTPSLHTNPVTVTVAGQPIRASRSSAMWCAATIEQLWKVRGPEILKEERDEAEKTFKAAIATYRKIATEAGGE